MNYETLEQDFVARLSAKLPNVAQVQPMPESDAEVLKPDNGCVVTVAYTGSKFGESNHTRGSMRSTAQISQTETCQVEIVLKSRFLRVEPYSIFAILPQIKKALLGFQATDCDRAYMTGQQMMVDENRNTDEFTWVLSFETTTLAVEDYDETQDQLGVLHDVIFNWP